MPAMGFVGLVGTSLVIGAIVVLLFKYFLKLQQRSDSTSAINLDELLDRQDKLISHFAFHKYSTTKKDTNKRGLVVVTNGVSSLGRVSGWSLLGNDVVMDYMPESRVCMLYNIHSYLLCVYTHVLLFIYIYIISFLNVRLHVYIYIYIYIFICHT